MKFYIGQRVKYIHGDLGIIIEMDNWPPNILIKLKPSNRKYWVFKQDEKPLIITDLMDLIK